MMTLREEIEKWEDTLKPIPIFRSVFYKSKSSNYSRYKGKRPGNWRPSEARKKRTKLTST